LFDPAKAGAFVTALALWLFAELFPLPPASTHAAALDAHDLELGKKLRGIATDDFIRFLDEHDFGVSFRDSNTAPLYELADVVRNASSAFNNAQLQAALEATKIEAIALSRMVSHGAWPKHGKLSLYTMIPDGELDGMWSEATEAKVAATNAKADELSAALKALLALLRKKGLPLVPTPDATRAVQIFV
jgi:hypothetical protein